MVAAMATAEWGTVTAREAGRSPQAGAGGPPPRDPVRESNRSPLVAGDTERRSRRPEAAEGAGEWAPLRRESAAADGLQLRLELMLRFNAAERSEC